MSHSHGWQAALECCQGGRQTRIKSATYQLVTVICVELYWGRGGWKKLCLCASNCWDVFWGGGGGGGRRHQGFMLLQHVFWKHDADSARSADRQVAGSKQLTEQGQGADWSAGQNRNIFRPRVAPSCFAPQNSRWVVLLLLLITHSPVATSPGRVVASAAWTGKPGVGFSGLEWKEAERLMEWSGTRCRLFQKR